MRVQPTTPTPREGELPGIPPRRGYAVIAAGLLGGADAG